MVCASSFYYSCFLNILEPTIIKNLIFSKIQSDSLNEISKDELNLTFQKIKAYYSGNFSGQLSQGIKAGADQYKRLLSVALSSKIVIFLSAIILFTGFALKIFQIMFMQEKVSKKL